MPQVLGSADIVLGIPSSQGRGPPAAPIPTGMVEITNNTIATGDVGTAGTAPDHPEPEQASEAPAGESDSQPSLHLQLVRQQRKLEQVSPGPSKESFCP